MLRNRNSKPSSELVAKYRRFAVSTFLASQLFTFGQADDNRTLTSGGAWQPRPGSILPQTPSRDVDRGWSEAASPSTSREAKWVKSGALPASPWDRSKEPTRATSDERYSPNYPQHANDAGFSTPRLPNQPISNLIRQPSQSLGYPAQTNPTSFASSRDGAFSTQRPNTSLPAVPVSTVAHSTTATTYSEEPQLAESPAPSDYTEQARVYEAMANASLVLNEPEYQSQAPSSVVGLVAGSNASQPAAMIRTAPSQPVFIPETPPQTQYVIQASMAEVEADEAKKRLASRVSNELLRDARQPLQQSPLPVESPTGWKSIEGDLQQRLTRCEELLRRNAVMSAREEVLAGIRTLLRAIDLRTGVWAGEPAFDQALTAFVEEADFHSSLNTPDRSASTSAIVSCHSTPILKNTDLHNVSPELAAQHYRGFARQQMASAAQRHPWAADLYFALGKTLERQADLGKDNGSMHRNQAVACYEAAMMINSGHAGGIHQLGYALLKLDRVDEAHDALHRSLQIQPTSETWRSLAEVYRRRGQIQQVSYAESQSVALAATQPKSNIPEVNYLEPQTFAEISPNHFVGHPSGTVPAAANSMSAPPAVSNTSWWGRLWR